ncbi:hypothetical protein E0L35_10060 [Halomonas sp. ATBC28]|uniref:hypothetical protein n=1 Tax=Halomonas sp. ATBC28 TaxID=2545264 RepID=UPI00110DB18E|nr:hypothetical protein [Halomonas sp. ATBC28]TMU24574.1 hypothetical protein E0L35_10060 [Halomonas sp. ATBC28]
MAIDPNWVRENPEEAAKQLDVLGEMHVDHVRYLWELRGFGGCVEFAEAFDSLEKKYAALSLAKLEAMPADLKDRYLVVRINDIWHQTEVNKIGKELRKHCSGVGIFWNMDVDIEALDMTKRDALKQAEALEEAAAETVPAMHKMANWLIARAAEKRRKAAPWATTCIECQGIRELRGRHVRK